MWVMVPQVRVSMRDVLCISRDSPKSATLAVMPVSESCAKHRCSALKAIQTGQSQPASHQSITPEEGSPLAIQVHFPSSSDWNLSPLPMTAVVQTPICTSLIRQNQRWLCLQ